MTEHYLVMSSQSISQARTIYQFVKTYNQLIGSLEDAVADLSKQYAQSKPVKEPTTAPRQATQPRWWAQLAKMWAAKNAT
jgi:uncharacterized protein (DUF2236 family)